MNKTKGFFVLILSAVSILDSQDYIWPVNLGRSISSNFAEFRPRRFHAGIDIKTGGATGHEVLAIDDGYIWRIKVSSDGYGKVIYLRLNDSNTVVYAHLDGFTPLLDDIVRFEQSRHNAYGIEKYLAPDEIVVTKGEILGYSGESGRATGPHLHFELRDSTQRPRNPLTSGFDIPDRRRPEAEALAIIPLSLDAMTNGSPLPQTFPLRYVGPGEYEFPDTIHVYGTVGLAVRATDKITGFPNRFNIYGAALFVDGIEQYRIGFDSFSFDQSHLVEIQRDNSLRRLNDGEFHRLFIARQSDNLDFVHENSRGRLKLSSGHHRISIRLFDHARNVAKISGILYFAPPIKVKAHVVGKTARSLRVVLQPDGSPFPLSDFVCYSFNERGYPEKKIESVSTRSDGLALTVDLEGIPRRYRVLQFIGTDKFGGVSQPFHLPLDGDDANSMDASVDFGVAHLENSVVLQIESRTFLPFPPEVYLWGQKSEQPVDMIQIRPTTFLSRPMKPDRLQDVQEVSVRIQGSPTREVRFQFRPRLATAEGSSAAVSPDGRCSLQTLSTTFYDTTVFWIETVVHPVPVEGGRFVTGTYQLQPFDRPLMDSARVAISLPESVENPAGMGIFYYDQKRGWTYLPSHFSGKKWMFFSSVYSLEAVAVVEDSIRPVIKNIFPGPGGLYDPEDVKLISALVDDDLAGIEGDQAIRMILDGRNLIFEYQPVKKVATYRMDEPPLSGDHTLEIVATDRVGNSISKKISFSVN